MKKVMLVATCALFAVATVVAQNDKKAEPAKMEPAKKDAPAKAEPVSAKKGDAKEAPKKGAPAAVKSDAKPAEKK